MPLLPQQIVLDSARLENITTNTYDPWYPHMAGIPAQLTQQERNRLLRKGREAAIKSLQLGTLTSSSCLDCKTKRSNGIAFYARRPELVWMCYDCWTKRLNGGSPEFDEWARIDTPSASKIDPFITKHGKLRPCWYCNKKAQCWTSGSLRYPEVTPSCIKCCTSLNKPYWLPEQRDMAQVAVDEKLATKEYWRTQYRDQKQRNTKTTEVCHRCGDVPYAYTVYDDPTPRVTTICKDCADKESQLTYGTRKQATEMAQKLVEKAKQASSEALPQWLQDLQTFDTSTAFQKLGNQVFAATEPEEYGYPTPRKWAQLGYLMKCDHNWIDATNNHVKDTAWCTKCGAVRPLSAVTSTPKDQAVVSVVQRDEVVVDPEVGKEESMHTAQPYAISWKRIEQPSAHSFVLRDTTFSISDSKLDHDKGKALAVPNDPIAAAWSELYSSESVYFDRETRFWLILGSHKQADLTPKPVYVYSRATDWARDLPEVGREIRKGDRYLWLKRDGGIQCSAKDYRDLCIAIRNYETAMQLSPVTQAQPKEIKPMNLEKGEIGVAILVQKSQEQLCPNAPRPGKLWAPAGRDARYSGSHIPTDHNFIVKGPSQILEGEGRNGGEAMGVPIQCMNCGVEDTVFANSGAQKGFQIIKALEKYGARDPYDHVTVHNKLPNGQSILRTYVKGISTKAESPLHRVLSLPWRATKATGRGAKMALKSKMAWVLASVVSLIIGGFWGIPAAVETYDAVQAEQCATAKKTGVVESAQHLEDQLYLKFKGAIEQIKLHTDYQVSLPVVGEKGYICENGHFHHINDVLKPDPKPDLKLPLKVKAAVAKPDLKLPLKVKAAVAVEKAKQDIQALKKEIEKALDLKPKATPAPEQDEPEAEDFQF
jgi:hypothetical protein